MSVLLDLVARVVVLLSLVGLVTVLLRGRSASMRASVWTAAFGAVLLMPAIAAVTPAWRIPVLAPRSDNPALEVTPPNHPAYRSYPGIETTPPATSPRTVAVALNIAPHLESAPSNQSLAPGLPAAPAQPVRDWTMYLVTLMAVGSLVLLIRLAFGHWRMRRVGRTAADAGDDWRTLVDDVQAELEISRPVPVRVTGETNVPAIWGIRRPVLLLPIETSDWPPEVRRAVVLHELAHVVRSDSFSQLLGQIACAIYWFVPLTWYGARRADAFRERACDDMVLQSGVPASAYAGSLVTIAESTIGTLHSSATLAMAHRSRISERVVAILNPVLRREPLSWRSAAALLILIGAVTAVVGAIEPSVREIEPAGVVSDPGAVFEQPATAIPAPRTVKVTSEVPAREAQSPAPGSGSELAAAMADMQTVAPAQSSDRICGGRALDKSSSSIHENDNERRWTVSLSGGDCKVDLRAEGKIDFTADFTDISQISQNGFFRLDVTDRGVRRQLDIESRGGTLTRTWRVDGREQPYDAAARTWFANFLVELDRRTGIGVDIRLPLLVKQGGVDAVLKETALMPSDYARHQYYQKLPAATKLTPAQMTQVIRQASAMNSSDHYSAELVRAYVSGVQDATVRTALVELVERMKSDHYQATSIETILGKGAPGQVEMDVMMRLVPKMSSDHYKTQVLLKVLSADSITPAHRTAIAGAVSTISSDHYAAEVLSTLARKGMNDDAVRRAFFDAAGRMRSDHYRGQVLSAVLAMPSVTERELLDAVASAKSMSSDHYKSQVLAQSARHRAATDKVRSAVLEASAGMSKSYADEVRRAAGK
jgi:beta-lactamase regulating signal transducer with metallopeptidase domain